MFLWIGLCLRQEIAMNAGRPRMLFAEGAVEAGDAVPAFDGRGPRFSDLERAIPGVSQKMRIQQLDKSRLMGSWPGSPARRLPGWSSNI
jgi:hypothetical protein